MKSNITQKANIPKGVTVSVIDNTVTVKGPKGELSRTFSSNDVTILVQNDTIVLSAKNATRREQMQLYTFLSHVKNMMDGVLSPWIYTLKVCAGHFPINVKVENNSLIVKNFLGEKTPRHLKLPTGVKVTAVGNDVTVESTDVEKAGNVASRIELFTRVRNRDLRIFQDGIHIVTKGKR